jgi:regulator of protease activity HflC (stomatin/prohibitin superfamily)
MQEHKAWAIPGFLGLLLVLLASALGLYLIVFGGNTGQWVTVVIGIFVLTAGCVGFNGLFIVHPNEARAVVFFGRYVGSVRNSGWWFTNPLTTRQTVSLRVRNFNSERLKVNDAAGNPIEIAAVVVYKVVDSAKALFDVDNYDKFVAIQSETALRQLATSLPYDSYDNDQESLRGNPEEVAADLRREVQNRLNAAGVEVLEARLTHLAYAPEIASAMLQRQQAAAILAARQIIVEGAVGMVQMAVTQLSENGTVELDEERKAAMINNLMVAIISERNVQPVINTGTLYK